MSRPPTVAERTEGSLLEAFDRAAREAKDAYAHLGRSVVVASAMGRSIPVDETLLGWVVRARRCQQAQDLAWSAYLSARKAAQP